VKKSLLLSVVFIAFVAISCIIFYFSTLQNNQNKSSTVSDQENLIKSLFPNGSFLRDFQKVPGQNNTYLAIYIESGYQFNSWELSCPGMILGDSIIGKYHLSLIQNGQIINDLTLPEFYDNNNRLELTYKNYTDGWPSEGETKQKEIIKLLDFQDLTGDGLDYEFLLTTTTGGCSLYNRLVGAYDPDQNKAVLYSNWLFRFEPDSSGKSYYLFDCGDHGNEKKIEKQYQFNKTTKTYEVIWEKENPCIIN